MPWQCGQCKAAVDDDFRNACPACGAVKTSWTVHHKTRTLRVGPAVRRFVCEHGTGSAPVVGAVTGPFDPISLAAAYDQESWASTKVAPALSAAEAVKHKLANRGPASKDVLRVRQVLGPKDKAPTDVTLTLPIAGQRAVERTFPARPGAPFDARFLLLYGEIPSTLSFEGLQIVDVTEEAGHLPFIEVAALNTKTPQKLDLVPGAPTTSIEPLRGHSHDAVALPASDQPYAKSTLGPTNEVAVLHREEARRLHSLRMVPAPRDLLLLRCGAGALAEAERKVTVRIPLRPPGGNRLPEERVYEFTHEPGGQPLTGETFDLPLVCVYGKEDGGPIDLEGHIHTIDVSDPHPDGTEDVAPEVIVEGLGVEPQTLRVAVRSPRIVRFVGIAHSPDQALYQPPYQPGKKPKDTAPSDRVVVHQGWGLRLEWRVLGPVDGITFSPPLPAKDIVPGKRPGEGSIEVDLLTTPPTADGRFVLSVRDDSAPRTLGPAGLEGIGPGKAERAGQGDPAPPAEPPPLTDAELEAALLRSEARAVTVIAITRFTVQCVADDPRYPLHEYDHGVRWAKPDPIPGGILHGRAATHEKYPDRAGILALGKSDENTQFVWFGTVKNTLKPWVLLKWTIMGPRDLHLELEVPGLSIGGKAQDPWDVGPETRAGAGSSSREVQAIFIEAAKTKPVLDCELSIWPAGVPRRSDTRLTCSLIRLRIDRPLPEILGFDVASASLVGPLADGAELSTWEDVQFGWRLGGDHKGCRLHLTVVEAGRENEEPLVPLYEVDLKEAGTVQSHGFFSPKGKTAIDVSGRTLVAVADLLRSPQNELEEARGKPVNPWRTTKGDITPRGRRTFRFKIKAPTIEEKDLGKFPCVASADPDDCPINEAIELHRIYLQKLEEWEETFRKHQVRLENAMFVESVIDRAADPRKQKEGTTPFHLNDLLKALKPGKTTMSRWSTKEHLHPTGDDVAIHEKPTYLADDLQFMKQEIFRAENAAHMACIELADHLKSKAFQSHLDLDAHVKFHVIDMGNVADAGALYGLELEEDGPDHVIDVLGIWHEGVPMSRMTKVQARVLLGTHRDHAIAMLTECMDRTQIGRHFLTEMLQGQEAWGPAKFVDAASKVNNLFQDRKGVVVIEPHGKFIFNLRQPIQDKITESLALKRAQQASNDYMAAIDEWLVEDTTLQRLSKYLGDDQTRAISPNLKAAVLEQAVKTKEKLVLAEKLKLRSEELNGLVYDIESKLKNRNKLLDDIAAECETDGAKAAKLQITGLYASMLIDTLALAITAAKVYADWEWAAKMERRKMAVGLVKDIAGFGKTFAEITEAALLRRNVSSGISVSSDGTLLRLAEGAGSKPNYVPVPASNAAAAEGAIMRAGAARCVGFLAKCANFVGQICGALLALNDAVDGFNTREWKAVVVNGLMAGACILSIFFPGWGALACLLVFILSECILDSPLVNWLERTEWGIDPDKYPVQYTVAGFYQIDGMFPLSARLSGDEISDDEELLIMSTLLTPDVDVCLAIVGPGEAAQFGENIIHEAGTAPPADPAKGIIFRPTDRELVSQFHGGKCAAVRFREGDKADNGAQLLRIGRVWEALLISRTNKEHDIIVGLNLDRKGLIERVVRVRDINFRPPPAPMFWRLANGDVIGRKGSFGRGQNPKNWDSWFYFSDEWCWLDVETRFAHMCALRLTVFSKLHWGQGEKTWVQEDFTVTEEKTHGSVTVTPLRIMMGAPKKDDYYEVRVRLELYDRGFKAGEAEPIAKFESQVMGVAPRAWVEARR